MGVAVPGDAPLTPWRLEEAFALVEADGVHRHPGCSGQLFDPILHEWVLRIRCSTRVGSGEKSAGVSALTEIGPEVWPRSLVGARSTRLRAIAREVWG